MQFLERIMTLVIFALFILMIGVVTIQILNRYGTQFSIPWTEELARTGYILLIFIGSALATLRGAHVTVRTGLNLMGPRLRWFTEVAAALMSAIFFAFVSYGNFIYTRVNWDSMFPTMSWLSIGLVMAVVFVASVLTSVFFIYQAFKLVLLSESMEKAS